MTSVSIFGRLQELYTEVSAILGDEDADRQFGLERTQEAVGMLLNELQRDSEAEADERMHGEEAVRGEAWANEAIALLVELVDLPIRKRVNGMMECIFCGVYNPTNPFHHKPKCLWRRARHFLMQGQSFNPQGGNYA